MSVTVINALNSVPAPIAKAVNVVGTQSVHLGCRVGGVMITSLILQSGGLEVIWQGFASLVYNLSVNSFVLPWINRHRVGVIALSPEATAMSIGLLNIGQLVVPVALRITWTIWKGQRDVKEIVGECYVGLIV